MHCSAKHFYTLRAGEAKLEKNKTGLEIREFMSLEENDRH